LGFDPEFQVWGEGGIFQIFKPSESGFEAL